jgi:hypothetical protein
MNTVAASCLVFAFAFGGAMLGVLVHRLLPDHELSSDSKDVVRITMGLVATTLALVLGLLVASAKGFYDTQNAEVTRLSADVLLLDRLLAHYGSEATEVRATLRTSVARQMKLMRKDSSGGFDTSLAPQAGEILVDKIQELPSSDDRQRSLQAQALTLAIELGQTRLLMLEQRRLPIPTLLLTTLVFWLFTLFASFGLFAPSNFTVHASFFAAAAAVSGAVFLILQMYYPYSGLIQISDAPLRAALAQLGQ